MRNEDGDPWSAFISDPISFVENSFLYIIIERNFISDVSFIIVVFCVKYIIFFVCSCENVYICGEKFAPI